MDEDRQEVSIELENIRTTIANLDKALGRTDKEIVELAAIGAFLHNFYSGMERILKRMVPQRPGTDSPSWHKDLLEKALEAGVISNQTADALFDFLGFRHLFTHGYTFCLNEAKLMALVNEVKPTFARFEHEISRFSGRHFG